MKNVLIIAPQFTPISAPPVHRVRLFVNHMPELGWNPTVLTIEPQFMDYALDPEFAQLVPTDLQVIRTKAIPIEWTRRLGIGEVGLRSFPFHLAKVRELCRDGKVDLLFIPGPPWYTNLIGPIIKGEFGVPYVLDYIDPWISSLAVPKFGTKAFWFRAAAVLLEPFAIRQASYIVSVSDGINALMRERYPFLKPEQLSSIRYGAEPADYEYLSAHPRPNHYWDTSDGLFHIVYVGGSNERGRDTLRALFRALQQLRAAGWQPEKRLRIHFFGTCTDPNRYDIMPYIVEEGVQDLVSEHPPRVPYLDAMNILCTSQASLGLGTSEHEYAASKLFTGLLSRRPLLGIFHEKTSPVAILQELQPENLVSYSDERPVLDHVDEIASLIQRLVEAGSVILPPPESSALTPYLARSTTETLVDLFNRSTQTAQREEDRVPT